MELMLVVWVLGLGLAAGAAVYGLGTLFPADLGGPPGHEVGLDLLDEEPGLDDRTVVLWPRLAYGPAVVDQPRSHRRSRGHHYTCRGSRDPAGWHPGPVPRPYGSWS